MRAGYKCIIAILFILGATGVKQPANSAESKEQWLGKRITEAKSIQQGSDQESFNRLFAAAAGKQTVPASRFALKSCRPIETDVTFGYAGTQMPDKPQASIKDPVVVSVSRLNLAHPQGLTQLSEQERWLVSLIEDAHKIKPGMSRTKLFETFEEDGGFQSIPATRYVHKHCAMVKLDVTFDTAGKSARAKRPIGSDDDLIILTVSQPYTDFQIYD